MKLDSENLDAMPVVPHLADFDRRSGTWLERLIFNYRLLMVLACALVTVLLGQQAVSKLTLNAGFEKMIPQSHPYVLNYFAHQKELRGLGNALRLVVENPRGDVYSAEYLHTLKLINDELFLTPGVDRAWLRSLWTPSVRWNQVTEEGFRGGEVMPSNYDGSAASIEQFRSNVARSSAAQGLIASDQKSSMIFVPLLERDRATGNPLDYRDLSARLESIRDKYAQGEVPVKIHIVGFAKLVGELLDGMLQVTAYFLAAALIAALIIYSYTHCLRSTTLVIVCSVIAVIWQLGLVSMLGFVIDPFSVLVPFLVFAIGVSHGAQKMNGIMQDCGRGTHKLVAARYTFRRLFLAGLTALLADAVGFGVLAVIDIPVIRDLAMTASLGVAVLVFTNLVLLPVLLSYIGVSPAAAQRSIREEGAVKTAHVSLHFFALLERFTERRWALGAIAVALVMAVGGFVVSLNLQIGDLDAGAPELRPDSRYNLDNAYITRHYALSSDQFAVIIKTPADQCLKYETLVEADRLAWALQQVPGVQTTVSLADAIRQITAGAYEGTPKWLTLARNQDSLNYAGQQAVVSNQELFNNNCSVIPVIAYLTDHKAQTLERVAAAATAFAAEHSTADRQFLLAAGNSGIEAATNAVVKQANRLMLLMVYAAVIVLCFITFRSWRAVVVAVLPLVLTSILCEALMVVLGMGVKVATLPVIALGAGIGVDYALYLLSVQLAYQRTGMDLTQAYRRALRFTGKVVFLVGVTLGAGVITWAWSPIKFQADMGILLTFMFLWNMLGALILIPALSHFLLRGPADQPVAHQHAHRGAGRIEPVHVAKPSVEA